MTKANAIEAIDRAVRDLRVAYRGRRGWGYVKYLSRVLWSIAGRVRQACGSRSADSRPYVS